MEEPWKADSGALITYLIFTVGLELVSNQSKCNIKLDSNVIVGSASLTNYDVSQQYLVDYFNVYMITVY